VYHVADPEKPQGYKDIIEDNHYMPAHGYEFYLWVVNSISHEWAQRTLLRYRVEHDYYINTKHYYINTSEIPNQLAFKGAIYYVIITTVISSRVKITCYLHVWRYELFARELTWYFTGVYMINTYINQSGATLKVPRNTAFVPLALSHTHWI